MSLTVLPMFSSKSFIVSVLIFRSLIHFEFIFVYGVRKCSNISLLNLGIYTFECRVPKNSRERLESLFQQSMQRNRGKQ